MSRDESISPITIEDATYGAVFAALCTCLIRYAHQLIRGRVRLGTGDILQMAALGAWRGYRTLLPAARFAFLCASLYAVWLLGTRQRRRFDTVPLGPFLTQGAICVLVTRDLGYLPAVFTS